MSRQFQRSLFLRMISYLANHVSLMCFFLWNKLNYNILYAQCTIISQCMQQMSRWVTKYKVLKHYVVCTASCFWEYHIFCAYCAHLIEYIVVFIKENHPKTFHRFYESYYAGCFYGRCPEGIGRHNVKMSVYMSLCLYLCQQWVSLKRVFWLK